MLDLFATARFILEGSLSMVKINVETLLDKGSFSPVHLGGEHRQLVCWMVV
jgi:hypothetical protein